MAPFLIIYLTQRDKNDGTYRHDRAVKM